MPACRRSRKRELRVAVIMQSSSRYHLSYYVAAQIKDFCKGSVKNHCINAVASLIFLCRCYDSNVFYAQRIEVLWHVRELCFLHTSTFHCIIPLFKNNGM